MRKSGSINYFFLSKSFRPTNLFPNMLGRALFSKSKPGATAGTWSFSAGELRKTETGELLELTDCPAYPTSKLLVQ